MKKRDDYEDHLNPPGIEDDGSVDWDEVEEQKVEKAMQAWKDGEA